MNKTWEMIKKILVGLVVVMAVCMMIFTLVTVLTCNQTERSLFGYKGFIVRSDSMSATDFSAGDLIVVKEVDPATLQEGDIISFTSNNTENFGEVVTHKIRRVTTDDNGNPAFVTYGTTTDSDDESLVTYEFVLGKYVKNLPAAGRLFAFIKTTPGYIVCIFLPFLILIIIQGMNSVRLFRQYKQEQMAEMTAAQEQQKAEMEAERKKLEEERLESQKMMQELMKLKEQMSGMQQTGAAAEGEANEPETEVKTAAESKPQAENEPAETSEDVPQP